MPRRALRLPTPARPRWILKAKPFQPNGHRHLSSSNKAPELQDDPPETPDHHHRPSYNPNDETSLSSLGQQIVSDYAHLRPSYLTPKHPIVLAHGLMGFDELHLLPSQWIPGIAYWRGIREAYHQHGIRAITTAVPTTSSIPHRAQVLMDQIALKVSPGTEVNIVAHSMGGLDARYMISRLCPPRDLFVVRSLTTIATPHRGSSAADMLFRDIGPDLLPHLYRLLARLKIDSGAFGQLTTTYMREQFNRVVPNSSDVRYFSYGASATPHLFSVFRLSHDLMKILEGENDGLVSVRSSKWGEYRGTLMGVTHLDLINWTNRIKRAAARLGLVETRYIAQAFYLAVAEGLAKEGF